ncbi:hypothetical protein AAFN47_14825 [Hoeflea sp. CAU 1731]
MSANAIERIDAELLAAHERSDGQALAWLYEAAAAFKDEQGDVDAACFFLTQAYVFALEAGLDQSAALRERLIANGREETPSGQIAEARIARQPAA